MSKEQTSCFLAKVSKSAGNKSGNNRGSQGILDETTLGQFFAFVIFLLFWFFFDSWQDEVLNIAKIGLLNRTFNSKGQVLCLLRKMWHHVDVDHDLRNVWNLTLVEMIIRRKVVTFLYS